MSESTGPGGWEQAPGTPHPDDPTRTYVQGEPPDEHSPTIDGLSPSTGPVGVATTVAVHGTNYQDGAVVRTIAGDMPTTWTNDGKVVADVTPDAAGPLFLTVRNPDGSESAPVSFTAT